MQPTKYHPKISIIVPVYNRRDLLTDCVKSLLTQTFNDFELHLIDDGSTDGSSLLCDELEKTDSRIRVKHVENGGVSSARRIGVEQAKGEWILFVDSDDTMPADALERLFQATSEDTDIVVGFPRKKRLWGQKKFSPVQYRKLLIEGRNNISVPWGKLFRYTLFNEHSLSVSPKIVMGEDMLMNIRLAFASSKPVHLVGGPSVYNYVQHGTNITHVFKITPDYEYLFHQERLSSIPPEEHRFYMPTIIHRRLRMLRRLLKQAQKNDNLSVLQDSLFVKELLADIHNTNYSFIHYPYWQLWSFLANTKKTEKY